MKKCFPIFFFVLSFCYAGAQTYQSDVQLYTGIQLNKDLPKGFDVSVQYQLRLENYLHSIRGSYFFGTVQYSIFKKFLSVEFEYRYVTSVWNDRHRFGIGLTGKYKFRKITFSDRIVYQREHEYFNSEYQSGHEPSNYIRNRVQIKWDFKKHWDVYISCEPFFKISNKEKGMDRVRTIAGLNWEFKKNHSLNLFYLAQPDINQSEPDLLHSIGLTYEWDIPKFKKQKKEDEKNLQP